MSSYEDVNFNDFFPVLETKLRDRLPVKLKNFKWDRPGNNYTRIKYPELKLSSFYELQFSERSRHHPKYFGARPHIIFAFYFYASLDKRSEWLEVLAPSVKGIGDQYGRVVKSGLWGTECACLITNFDHEPRTPEHFSDMMSSFIQLSYSPIASAINQIR